MPATPPPKLLDCGRCADASPVFASASPSGGMRRLHASGYGRLLACGNNRGMRGLPAGTVTLLFSDIEGSTALLSRLGDRHYAAALSAQRALLRAAFRGGGGRELGTEGDSFFVVFESAGDAVRCCVAA